MKPEAKVGLLFLFSILVVVALAYLMGAVQPFQRDKTVTLAFNYAGGIEVGSPVRVMGIKVGKVKAIDFDPTQKLESGEEVKLRIKISVDNKAWDTIRKDSQFFINLAGIIGEKFIEISPGSTDAPPLASSETVRGVDPPRVDQLVSQSYGLAGKIIALVEKNEGSIADTLKLMNNLVSNLNKTLVLLDKTSKQTDIAKLVKNMADISEDVAHLTGRMKGPEAEKTVQLLHKLIWRLDDLDKAAIKKFLQEEGVRARLF
jgi:phospholipid/cholesterol/gamma-HCH transport system substrate-binding protein